MLDNWAKLSGFAAILAAVLGASLLWALDYVPPQNVEWACEANADPQAPSKPAFKTFSCHAKQSENLNPQAAQAAKHDNQERSDNVKITDVFLAVFNCLLVIVTAVLIVVGIGQGNQLKAAVDASRAEFLATHRPRMRLKHIWFSTPDGERFFGLPPPNAPVHLKLDIVNVGNTIAYVRNINFAGSLLIPGQRLPQRPPYNEPGVPSYRIHDAEVPSGVTLGHVVGMRAMFTGEHLDRMRSGELRLYFVGTIEYWWGDNRDRLRQTAFCRYLAFEWPIREDDDGRFEIDHDPDYKYQD